MFNQSIDTSVGLRFKIVRFLNHWVRPIIDWRRAWQSLRGYYRYIADWREYARMLDVETLRFQDSYPCLSDRTTNTPFGAHYFYQGAWAARKIKESKVKEHIDVGSDIRWVGLLSTIAKVTFIDIRTFKTDLENLTVKKGNILNLPYKDNSIQSLSCLHVAEHIGLGRYGDKLNPDGTKLACKELQRVLMPGGNLYFSVPVGKEKTCFNAHRIHSPMTILDYFKNLKLIELSGVTDSGEFIRDIDIKTLKRSNYACGLFRFKKLK